MHQKPFKGEIYHWEKQACDPKPWPGELEPNLGYRIFGFRHPELKKLGTAFLTSPIVKHEGDTVETLNSHYKLIGEEEKGLITNVRPTG